MNMRENSSAQDLAILKSKYSMNQTRRAFEETPRPGLWARRGVSIDLSSPLNRFIPQSH